MFSSGAAFPTLGGEGIESSCWERKSSGEKEEGRGKKGGKRKEGRREGKGKKGGEGNQVATLYIPGSFSEWFSHSSEFRR